MASDIRFQGEAVLVEGQLAIGTATPQRPVHAESGEIHSGGPAGGLSFADRTTGGFVGSPGNGQRWVWFAEGGRAKLWSGADALSVRRDAAAGFAVAVNGTITATTITATTTSAANLSAGSVTANQLTANTVSSPNYTGTKVTVSGAIAAGSVTGNTISSPNYTGTKVAVTGPVTAGSVAANTISSPNYTGTKVAVTGPVTAGTVNAGTVSGDRLSVRTITGVREDEPSPVVTNVICRAHGLSLVDPAAPTRTEQAPTEIVGGDRVTRRQPDNAVAPAPPPPPPPPPPPTFPVPPRIALFHVFGPNSDQLVLNRFGRYTDGVAVEGDLIATGEVVEASSITMKDDVHTLTPAAAAAALRDLEAVTYLHKLDPGGARHVGFIAEHVPDLVAKPGRDRLRAMDIVAVLTTVVQEQQRALDDLAAEMERLQRTAPWDARPAAEATSP